MSLSEYLARLRSKPAVKVHIPCTCGNALPLEELYYCPDGCKALACEQCCTKVVDTYFCPSCLNSVFSTKAFEARNKCRQCAVCPVCAQTLGVVTKDDDKHYLRCECCKWTSEKLLTAPSAAALFDLLMTHEEQSGVSQEFHRLLGLLEDKVSKKKKLQELPFRQPSFQDVAAAVGRVEKSLEAKNKALHILPKEPVSNASAVPGVDGANSSCTMPPRLAHPEEVVRAAEDYWPTRVDLVTKMGCKCPRCEKFLIKPKAGANRTIFDVHSIALALLPRVTVGEFSGLQKGAKTKLLLYFKNPLEHTVELRFQNVESKGEEKATVAGENMSDVSFPAGVSLSPYEEAAEQAEGKPSALLQTDDPNHVGYRVDSKVGVYVEVTPRFDTVRFSVLVQMEVKASKPGPLPLDTFSFPLIVELGNVQA